MRIQQRLQATLLLLIVSIIVGCTAFEHGFTYNEVKNRLLITESGIGQKRLNIEKEYDKTIKAFVAGAGTPDYIYVKSQFHVQLIYLEQNYVADFKRSIIDLASEVTKTEGISSELMEKIDFANQNPDKGAFSFSD